jgi:hypothetical protein
MVPYRDGLLHGEKAIWPDVSKSNMHVGVGHLGVCIHKPFVKLENRIWRPSIEWRNNEEK